jgi:hypothetical protein
MAVLALSQMIMQTLQYIADHWSQISTAALTAATVIIHRGGIKLILISLWNSTPKPQPENPAQPQNKT